MKFDSNKNKIFNLLHMNCDKKNYRIIHGSKLLFIIGFTMLVFISLKLKDFKDIFLIFTERGPEIFCTKLWDEVPIISCLMWRGGLMVSKQQVHDWTMKMLSFFFSWYLCVISGVWLWLWVEGSKFMYSIAQLWFHQHWFRFF